MCFGFLSKRDSLCGVDGFEVGSCWSWRFKAGYSGFPLYSKNQYVVANFNSTHSVGNKVLKVTWQRLILVKYQPSRQDFYALPLATLKQKRLTPLRSNQHSLIWTFPSLLHLLEYADLHVPFWSWTLTKRETRLWLHFPRLPASKYVDSELCYKSNAKVWNTVKIVAECFVFFLSFTLDNDNKNNNNNNTTTATTTNNNNNKLAWSQNHSGVITKIQIPKHQTTVQVKKVTHYC